MTLRVPSVPRPAAFPAKARKRWARRIDPQSTAIGSAGPNIGRERRWGRRSSVAAESMELGRIRRAESSAENEPERQRDDVPDGPGHHQDGEQDGRRNWTGSSVLMPARQACPFAQTQARDRLWRRGARRDHPSAVRVAAHVPNRSLATLAAASPARLVQRRRGGHLANGACVHARRERELRTEIGLADGQRLRGG